MGFELSEVDLLSCIDESTEFIDSRLNYREQSKPPRIGGFTKSSCPIPSYTCRFTSFFIADMCKANLEEDSMRVVARLRQAVHEKQVSGALGWPMHVRINVSTRDSA